MLTGIKGVVSLSVCYTREKTDVCECVCVCVCVLHKGKDRRLCACVCLRNREGTMRKHLMDSSGIWETPDDCV